MASHVMFWQSEMIALWWRLKRTRDGSKEQQNNNWPILKYALAFPTKWIATKRTNHHQDQRHKYHHLTRPFHLTMKMNTAQVVETSVNNNNNNNNNSLPGHYSHLDDHNQGLKLTSVLICPWANHKSCFGFPIKSFGFPTPPYVRFYERDLSEGLTDLNDAWQRSYFNQISGFLVYAYCTNMSLLEISMSFERLGSQNNRIQWKAYKNYTAMRNVWYAQSVIALCSINHTVLLVKLHLHDDLKPEVAQGATIANYLVAPA